MGQTACLSIKIPLKENMVQTQLIWSKFSKKAISDELLSFFLTKFYLEKTTDSDQIK